VKPLTRGKEYWELPTGIADVTEYIPVMGIGKLFPAKTWLE
jgi:hypothetical protein